MTDLPDTLELRGSRLKWLGLLALVSPLILGGVLMVSSGDIIVGGLCLAFFALCGLVFLWQIIKPGRLTLGPDGFEQIMAGRTLTCRWDEVSDFGVYGVGVGLFKTNKFVCFSRLEDEGTRLASVNRALVGATAQLSDSFGMKPEALAELMNAFRNRALGIT